MNCPLTKEEFCSAIDTIKDYWDNMQKVEDAIGVVFSEGTIMNIMDSYADTLATVMRDELATDAPFDDVPWIMYFCWEKDFGRRYEERDVQIDGVEFPLTNSEELYDLLIKLYWTEEN